MKPENWHSATKPDYDDEIDPKLSANCHRIKFNLDISWSWHSRHIHRIHFIEHNNRLKRSIITHKRVWIIRLQASTGDWTNGEVKISFFCLLKRWKFEETSISVWWENRWKLSFVSWRKDYGSRLWSSSSYIVVGCAIRTKKTHKLNFWSDQAIACS